MISIRDGVCGVCVCVGGGVMGGGVMCVCVCVWGGGGYVWGGGAICAEQASTTNRGRHQIVDRLMSSAHSANVPMNQAEFILITCKVAKTYLSWLCCTIS